MIHGFVEENINKNLQNYIKFLFKKNPTSSTSKKATQKQFCFVFIDLLKVDGF